MRKIKNNIVTNNEITYNIFIDTDIIDSSRITLVLKLTTKEICEISPRLLFWRKDSDNVKKKLSIKLNDKSAIIKEIIFPSSFFFEELKNGLLEYNIMPKSTKSIIHERLKIVASSNDNIYINNTSLCKITRKSNYKIILDIIYIVRQM